MSFQGSVLSPLLFAVYINELIMSFPNNCRVYAILYADDILLISPTACMLQNMLTTCELELQALDLVINPKKSSCIRIGPRNDVTCVRICSSSGVLLSWAKEMKYLGVSYSTLVKLFNFFYYIFFSAVLPLYSE